MLWFSFNSLNWSVVESSLSWSDCFSFSSIFWLPKICYSVDSLSSWNWFMLSSWSFLSSLINYSCSSIIWLSFVSNLVFYSVKRLSIRSLSSSKNLLRSLSCYSDLALSSLIWSSISASFSSSYLSKSCSRFLYSSSLRFN